MVMMMAVNIQMIMAVRLFGLNNTDNELVGC